MIQRESSVSRARLHQSPEGPVRTCVGCRKRELASDMFRVAVVRGEDGNPAVSVDTAGNVPGRGAWLHPDQQCLHAAVRRRAFTRALRITGSPDTSAVVDWFTGLPGTAKIARQQNR